jgi:muramoyltetrapeptide carboxypeptidase
VIPRFLKPGDRVTVLAPSGLVDRKRLQAGLAYLRGRGHEPSLAPHVLDRHGYLAGGDEDRAADFNDVLASDPSGAIFFARGGYGLTRILDQLDLDELRRRPRLLLGFSDATALFMALQRTGPYVTHYGPLVSEMGEPAAFDEASLWAALYGEPAAFRIPFKAGDVLRPGRSLGHLIGGCLSLLVSILGTRHDPDYRDAILFWEEVCEPPYRIDRMLTQLRNAGKFDHLRGMIIGSLTGCEPEPGRPTLRIKEIVLELAQLASFPIVWNVRAGHVGGKLTLPLGLPASLNTRQRAIVLHPPAWQRLYPARYPSVAAL